MTANNTTDVDAWRCEKCGDALESDQPWLLKAEKRDKIGEPVGDDTISDNYVHEWCAGYEPVTGEYA